VLRNVGVALAHTALALQAVTQGLARVEIDALRIAADLDACWEVLAEPVQTIMRACGVPDGYEQLRAFTRGRPVDRERLQPSCYVEPASRRAATLLELTPNGYIGLAAHWRANLSVRPGNSTAKRDAVVRATRDAVRSPT